MPLVLLLQILQPRNSDFRIEFNDASYGCKPTHVYREIRFIDSYRAKGKIHEYRYYELQTDFKLHVFMFKGMKGRNGGNRPIEEADTHKTIFFEFVKSLREARFRSLFATVQISIFFSRLIKSER